MKHVLADPQAPAIARSAVLLTTLVLDSTGTKMTDLGRFLHTPEHPFRYTRDAEGTDVAIWGCAPLNVDELPSRDMLEITVDRREQAPLVGTLTTRVYDLDEGGWVTLQRLRAGTSIRLPERSPFGLMVSYARVKSIRRGPAPDRIWVGTPAIAGTLKLSRGAFSFATPSAFVHV